MKCEKCSKEHDGSYGSGRFCSRACANSRDHTIASRKKTSLSLGGTGRVRDLKEHKCLNCSKNTKNQYFCSNKCHGQYQWKKWREKVLTSGKFPIKHQQTGGKVANVKKFLIEERGYKCEICGRSEWDSQKIPLIVDHINGHANDWSVENIRIICPNCDALLPTYGGRNKGNGTRKFSLRTVN